MKKLLLLTLLIPGILPAIRGHAQEKWDLRRCVEYALANNISIKQADVQARLSKLTLDQSKLSQIPTLGLGVGAGINSGRRQNPTDFSLSTQTFFANNYSLQTSGNIFNFFSLKNSIAANRLSWQAALANSDKVKNDVSLNVANAYLQVLLSDEQLEASKLQLKLSQNSLEITRKQVNAGTLPELNAAELESQVAQDSSNVITSQGTIIQNILNLKAYMGLDAGTPFEVDTPPVEQIPIEKVADLQPEAVYALAIANQPLQKMDQYLVESARRTVDANRGAMYPSLSVVGSLGTNYISSAQEPILSTLTPFVDTIAKVAGTNQAVVVNNVTYQTRKMPYFKQLDQNFSQYIGVQLNVPIFQGGQLRTSYSKSKLNLRNQELQRDQDNLTLKQNIYQAYTAAITALQKFEANKITAAATTKSFDYAQKRYNVGMLNTIDLLTNQNNFFKAKVDLLYAQYDYVFKMKVLEFYKGLGIRLSK